MTFILRVTWAALLYNVVVACEFQTNLIKNITYALSSRFQIGCLAIFHSLNDTEDEFETFKALSSDPKITVGVFTFEDRSRGKMCTRPMNILIGEGFKGEFAAFTTSYSMADEMWLIFLKSSVFDFFEESRPSFDSEVVAAEVLSPEEVQFREVYSVDNHFPLRIVEFGNWTQWEGLKLPPEPVYDRRTDLEGKVLRVGSNENWPVCSFRGGVWDGYMPRLWKEIDSLINCTTVPVRSKDNATGLEFKNRTWNGLMGMLLNYEIDVIAAELTVTKRRTEVLRFGCPALSSKYQVYFKALGYRLEWKAIFKPLALSTWLALFGWTIIGSLAISLSYYWYVKTGFKDGEMVNFTVTESFFFVLQSLCQQGYPVVPKSLACRIIFVTAYALSTIMIPSYSASLISSLTHQTPIKPFDTLQDMVKDGKYKLLVKKNSAAFSQFSQATDHLYARAYNELMNHKYQNVEIDNSVEVLNQIVCNNKNFALFGIDLIINLKMEYQRPKCTILSFARPLNPVFAALGFRKESPYGRIIDYKLQKLMNFGSLARLKSNLRPLGADRSGSLQFRQVEVDEVFQIFLLLLMGMIMSVTILFVENTIWKYDGRPVKSSKAKTPERKCSAYMIRFDVYLD